MTGLKESAQVMVLKDISFSDWAERYIKEAETHMRGWFISDIWVHDERCDCDIQSAIGEMLKFLKGEGVK